MMGRIPRYFSPNSLVEVTTRTVHSRYLLPPTRHFAKILVGILARAQKQAPVRVHAVAGLSNHLHYLLTVDDAEQLSDFMEYANGNIAREAGRIVGWREKFWGRRFSAIPVSDEELAQVQRLRYFLSHGAKENLVTSPREWPGFHCVDEMIEGRPLQGVWHDRTREYEAHRRGQSLATDSFVSEYSLPLTQLPCWGHLTATEYGRRVREMVEDIEIETARRIFVTGQVPPGPEVIRAQDPHGHPRRTKRSMAPRCHAVSKEARELLREAYRLFVAAYRHAAKQLCRGDRDVRFPEGCFPPGLPFVKFELVSTEVSIRAGP